MNHPNKHHRSLILAAALLVGALGAAAPAQAGVPVFSLHANRALAHLDQQGLVLDAGSPAFLRYVRGNFGQRWAVDRKLDGQRVTLVSGRQGKLAFPLSAAQAKATRLELHMRGLAPKQRVTVFVNGKNLGDLEVAGQWHTGSKEIPAGVLRAGENHLRLTFRRSKKQLGTRTAAALRWIRFVLPGAKPLGDDGPELAITRGDALRLPAQGGLGYLLLAPKGSTLELEAVPESGTCHLDVLREAAAGRSERLAGFDLPAGGGKVQADLQASGRDVMRVDLQASGAGCTGILLQGAQLVAPGAATPSAARGAKPRQVIFWMVDTLRADRLGVYTKTRVETPSIDRLAAEGTTFMRYSVEGNESKVSHASFFTGVYPMVHKVLGEKAKLPNKLVTIAEAMKKGGLKTAGLISNGYVSDRWNYHQGFSTYRNYIREELRSDAKAVVGHGINWLDRNAAAGPYYLYLGTIDPHVTYRAHKGIIEKYDPKPYKGGFRRYLSGGELGKIKSGKKRVSDRDKLRIEALYDNEITYNDKYFGELIAYLEKKGELDKTLIIITGDHGDEFWEHGSCGHGHSVYQELVATPLIIRYPALFPKGKKVMVEADGVDILPTLMDSLQLPIPEAVQGESLMPYVLGDGPVYPRTSISTHYDQIYALRSGDWKIILSKGGKIRLFDLTKDPGEKENVAKGNPLAKRYLLDALSLFLGNQRKWKKSTWGVPTNMQPQFGRDLRLP